MKKYRLGVIGFGHMSSAIIRGALANQVLSTANTAVCDTSPARIAYADELKLDHFSDPAELCRECEYVLFAVKPQDMPVMLESLKNVQIENLLSIVTGWSLCDIRKYIPGDSMIRIMPNTPMQVSHGAAFWAA
ncbi:MAG: NAD(P)-binding domain-containing protein, partial [Solobacterium sp.]|nr:NAD(P)-binding domain-containing protein [Solobacterium sp.]